MIPTVERRRLDDLIAGLRELLGDDLVGVYVHGSLAFGCHGPRSDFDALAVSSRPTTVEERERLAALVQKPLEFHLLVEGEIKPWRHPLPFDFHEGRRGLDYDLAAHLTVAREVGITAYGPPPAELFAPVPAEDYADAVRRDVDWALTKHREDLLYVTLTLPRAWATLTTGAIYSKVSAGEWALPQLPPELRPVLDHALALYRGELEEESWAALPVEDYVEYVAAKFAS
jgi:predicted nucleotidyltransferase